MDKEALIRGGGVHVYPRSGWTKLAFTQERDDVERCEGTGRGDRWPIAGTTRKGQDMGNGTTYLRSLINASICSPSLSTNNLSLLRRASMMTSVTDWFPSDWETDACGWSDDGLDGFEMI